MEFEDVASVGQHQALGLLTCSSKGCNVDLIFLPMRDTVIQLQSWNGLSPLQGHTWLCLSCFAYHQLGFTSVYFSIIMTFSFCFSQHRTNFSLGIPKVANWNQVEKSSKKQLGPPNWGISILPGLDPTFTINPTIEQFYDFPDIWELGVCTDILIGKTGGCSSKKKS